MPHNRSRWLRLCSQVQRISDILVWHFVNESDMPSTFNCSNPKGLTPCDQRWIDLYRTKTRSSMMKITVHGEDHLVIEYGHTSSYAIVGEKEWRTDRWSSKCKCILDVNYRTRELLQDTNIWVTVGITADTLSGPIGSSLPPSLSLAMDFLFWQQTLSCVPFYSGDLYGCQCPLRPLWPLLKLITVFLQTFHLVSANHIWCIAILICCAQVFPHVTIEDVRLFLYVGQALRYLSCSPSEILLRHNLTGVGTGPLEPNFKQERTSRVCRSRP